MPAEAATGRVTLAFDMYPVAVDIGGTTYQNARALVADGVFYVYTLGSSGPLVLFEREVLAGPSGSEGVGISILTDAGEVWVQRTGGCACGAKLPTIDLFPGRQKVYTGVRK